MPIFQTRQQLSEHLALQRDASQSIGLVPTMGALHDGHLALVKKCLAENDTVVVSIFVNPTQFNNAEDLEKYPRGLESDLKLLDTVSSEIVVFAPTVEAIYGDRPKSQEYEFDGLDKVMEGAFRPGHFNGVGTIVELLLRAVAPHRAYFGEKDFQQLQIIRKLAELQEIPVEIIGCPIEREPNGLAMSSRNQRLTDSTRKASGIIHDCLQTAKTKFGTESAKDIADWVKRTFDKVESFDLEYFEIVDELTLTPSQNNLINLKYRAFIAVYADEVRLIDNLRLN
ncbi:MAG: pantoate--beta-alanine ligase [Bacteroidota bacterium]